MANKTSILKYRGTISLEETDKTCLVTVDGNEPVELLVPDTFNGDLEINVLANAVANIVLLKAMKISIHLKRNAYVEITTIDLYSKSMDLVASLDGENASIVVKSLVVSANVEKTKQIISHNAVNTNSEIQNYGVCLKCGEIYFDTTGKIENGMHGSSCRQLSKGFILGDQGIISSKPILLIDEFDVKAYHGASIGKLNDDDLFYLMSRGLSMKEAYTLVLNGIIQPFLNEIKDENLQLSVKNKIDDMM